MCLVLNARSDCLLVSRQAVLSFCDAVVTSRRDTWMNWEAGFCVCVCVCIILYYVCVSVCYVKSTIIIFYPEFEKVGKLSLPLQVKIAFPPIYNYKYNVPIFNIINFPLTYYSLPTIPKYRKSGNFRC